MIIIMRYPVRYSGSRDGKLKLCPICYAVSSLPHKDKLLSYSLHSAPRKYGDLLSSSSSMPRTWTWSIMRILLLGLPLWLCITFFSSSSWIIINVDVENSASRSHYIVQVLAAPSDSQTSPIISFLLHYNRVLGNRDKIMLTLPIWGVSRIKRINILIVKYLYE